jgi:hypothetical protein
MGKVAEIKTKQNEASVEEFLKTIKDEQQRKDSMAIIKMMKKATKEEPKMWGSSMIGFGKLRYKSPASGREVDWFNIGFAPRKANISLHLTMSLNAHSPLLKKLGKHKTGAGCLYINKLEDVDIKVLEQMINDSVKDR